MRQLLFICFSLCIYTTAMSQTGRFKGSVLDEATKTPLELATVSILKQDSSLITYQLSDKEGLFSFDKLPLQQKLLVSVTYVGYKSHYSSIQLAAGKTDTLSVSLALNTDTNAVVVTAKIPVRMNGDTLEINPAAFAMREDAVVEELLNQVSGIVIWSDGSITVNGRKVQNLMVDGKPFMGATDSRVATQNLPKSAIDKIQLYQEYDRSKIGQVQQPQDSLLTMNIKLKEGSKKGFFGKASVGYGTRERYESDLSFQMYNKQSSVGIGGGINNINKNIGNIQEMFQNNTYRNTNPNLNNVGRFGTNGINRIYSLGGVLVHSFIEDANTRQNNRLSINYNSSGADAYLTDLTLQNRTIVNNKQFNREEGVQNNRQDRHDVGVNYIKTNSYNDNLSLNGTFGTNNERNNSTRYTEVRDTSQQLQSTNNNTTWSKRRSDNQSFRGSFAKSNYEDPVKDFTLSVNGSRNNSLTDRNTKTAFQSLIDPSKSTNFDRHYTTINEGINIRGDLNYAGLKRLLFGRYNLFGITTYINQSFNYSRLKDDVWVGDFENASKQYKKNSSLSNRNTRELVEYAPTLSFAKYFSKFSNVKYRYLNLQVTLIEDIKKERNSSSFAKRNLDRSFQFFRYESNINFQFQKQQKYQYYASLNYAKRFDYPSVDQLYTIVDDINQYSVRVGNPYLRNRVIHNLNANTSFSTQNPKSKYAVNGGISGTYMRILNPITDSTINDRSGKRTFYYINADKSRNLSLNPNFNISRKLRKSNIQLMYNGSFSTGQSPNYIDSRYNISETKNMSNNATLQFSLRSLLIVNVGHTLQQYQTKQTAAGLTPFKNSNNNTKVGVTLNYPGNFTFSTSLEQIDNSNLKKPIMLWNSFATYRFMKQQGELKFSAMDLLKQYQNISNSVDIYGTTTRITNGLQQYFLLTFSYYPRKFGKTEIKKQAPPSAPSGTVIYY